MRIWRYLIPFVLLGLACRALALENFTQPPASQALPTDMSAVVPTWTVGIPPTRTTPPTAAAGLRPTAPSLSPLSSGAFEVRLHPDGPLYVGDRISFEVLIAADNFRPGQSVEIAFQSVEASEKKYQIDFGPFGIGGRPQATLMWGWNTTGLVHGEHTVVFSVYPDELTWTQTVTLYPSEAVPPPEPQATWAAAESECCLVYYITGTEAERDLATLLAILDEQTDLAIQRMGIQLQEPVSVVLMPRVLGHGGFAGKEIALSYLDRNYAGDTIDMVAHHEIVHILDARLGGELRPSILVEGLAVYLSGGHFKPEALTQRAAALLPPQEGCIPLDETLVHLPDDQPTCGLGWYIPLSSMIDNFYFVQHEIGYLQAAALIEYMLDTWGWQAYFEFYRDIRPQPDNPEEQTAAGYQQRALERALQDHFGLSLVQLEARFVESLQAEFVSAEQSADVLLTVRYFDTLRRYQRLLDPSAYFLTAWLPDTIQMRERGIVADFLRRPMHPENIRLETWLVEAFQALKNGDYAAAQERLSLVNAILDSLDSLEALK
jgi:hypothetical protein